MHMDKHNLIATLRAHEPVLKAAGIVHLSLHGSRITGDARDNSDVDLAAQFDRSKVSSILHEVNLKNTLSTMLGADVDLCNADMLEPAVEDNFRREAELVF
jgi:uncharacterized protein